MSESQREQEKDGGERSSTPEEEQAGRERAPQQASPREMTVDEIESSGTDGKGTGGVGVDLGGSGPVPGSEGTV